jgi:protein-disulfide isomerase/cyclophilin family peptidyl-prolyl cis-trans isomerase
MRKSVLFVSLMILVLLSSCVPATTMPQWADTATTAPVMVTDTPAPTIAMESPTALPEQAVVQTTGTCSVFDTKIRPTDWVKGNPDAKITFTVYSDFQCPYCAKLAPTLSEIVAKYPDDIRVVFRHFPLPNHPHALISAQAAEAAGLQGKFWEYEEALFTNQSDWSALDNTAVEEYFVKLAVELGLKQDQFIQDMKSDAIVQKVKTSQDTAMSENVAYTPFFLVNGMEWQGTDIEILSSLIETLKVKNPYFESCPPTVVDTQKSYTATLATSRGDIVIQLFADSAPAAVNSLVFLGQQDWYANQQFFRVFTESATNGLQLVLTGDPSNTGFGSAGYSLTMDTSSKTFDKEGLVGMVNSSQFFITTAAQPSLNGNYPVIGEVIQGYELVKQMTSPGETIKSITITEK